MNKTIAIIAAAIVAVLVAVSLPTIAEARTCKCNGTGPAQIDRAP